MRGCNQTVEQKKEIWQHDPPIGSSSPFKVQIGNRISVRLYQNCRPNYLETALLQKGLVLLLDGKELIEEGVGFGVPVVKYKDKTYFSSSAQSWIEEEKNHCTLVKKFVLDTISRKRLGGGSYVNDKLYHFFHRAFEVGYMNFQGLAQASNRIMELRKTFKVQTEFLKVKPRGTVIFRYSCNPGEIRVAVELSLLELERCKEILILNEQGASFFRRYADSAGLVLFNQKIGGWTKIVADKASFSDLGQILTFKLENKSSTALFRGWEKTSGRFSWAGLGYSLPPRNSTFCYSIQLSLGKPFS